MLPDRPIFVIGPPRSGTSILYKTLCKHPDVAFMHNGFKKFPRAPRVGKLFATLRFVPRTPKEASAFWNTFGGERDDLMTEQHATPEVCAYYRDVVNGILRVSGVRRFVAKCPMHSIRLPWLDAVFPGALFVIAVRDWRAVVSSTVAKRKKDELRRRAFWGVRTPGWEELRDLPSEESAARTFRIVHEMLEGWEPRYPGRVHRIAYGRFCEDPRGVLHKLCDFADLRWTPEFESSLPRSLESADAKWRNFLAEEVIEKIRSRDGEVLDRYTEKAL